MTAIAIEILAQPPALLGTTITEKAKANSRDKNKFREIEIRPIVGAALASDGTFGVALFGV